MGLEKQSKRIEAETLKVTLSKLGKCGVLLMMCVVVAGPKKAGQDAQAVMESRTGELPVAGSAIQKASLEYTLEKNKPKEPFREIGKAKQKLHEMKMMVNSKKQMSCFEQ